MVILGSRAYIMNQHFDLTDLRLFVHVAKESSLTKAALRVHLSVPAASIRIKKLEESVGIKLVSRGSHGLSLTPAGQAFLHRAHLIFQELDHLKEDMQDYVGGVKGHISILANTTAISEFLPKAMHAFKTSHPNVKIDLREKLSHDIVRAVHERLTDVGIVAGHVFTEGLEVIPYRNDRLVLAVSKSHPLAKRAVISFKEALKYEFIGLHENSWLNSFLMQAASNIQTPLRMHIQVSNFEAICRMIEAGIGVSILPKSSALRLSHHTRIKLIRLSDDWVERNLVICVRVLRDLPSFAQDFVALLRSH